MSYQVIFNWRPCLFICATTSPLHQKCFGHLNTLLPRATVGPKMQCWHESEKGSGVFFRRWPRTSPWRWRTATMACHIHRSCTFCRWSECTSSFLEKEDAVTLTRRIPSHTSKGINWVRSWFCLDLLHEYSHNLGNWWESIRADYLSLLDTFSWLSGISELSSWKW